MYTIKSNLSLPRIKWAQIISLASLNAVVVFSWIAYNNYQPKVLENFNFQELDYFLAVAQAIIMVCVPPLAGLAGDFLIRKNKNNFVVFTTGIIITAMVFMAVAFSVSGNLFEGWRNILPILIIVWLVSMNIFISPANSMIEMFAPGSQLPIVMGVIVLITDLISALEPIIVNLIDYLGPTITFTLGGICIAIAGYSFKRLSQDVSFERPFISLRNKSNYVNVVIPGLLLGIIVAIIMNVIPGLLMVKLKNLNVNITTGNHYASLILFVAALLAIPLSKWTEVNGAKKGLLVGVMIATLGIALIFLLANSFTCIAACLLLAIGFSLTAVSAFPFAIQNLSEKNVALGAGLFFGATEVADQIYNVFSK